MWKGLGKAARNVADGARKAADEANIAAKKIAETKQFQKIQAKTKEIVESDAVQNLGEKVTKTTKDITTKVKDGFDPERRKEKASGGGGKSPPFSKIEVDVDGDGDMSVITWNDGTEESVRNLRVFGKNAKIVSASTQGIDEIIIEDKGDGCCGTDNARSPPVLSRGVSTEADEGFGKVHLPILMFPGIASSGLYVENSGISNEKYKGRRLWMNAGFLTQSALGNKVIEPTKSQDSFDAAASTTAEPSTRSDDADEIEFARAEDDLKIRSAWLYHIALDQNMVDERPGNQVRVYEGIKACEWLVDDALSKTQAGVWADCIKFLEDEMGYIRGTNIEAAPYDWRLPPNTTEARDGYLTKTMETVERMYEANAHLPVILACHSMGCKMGHYFLNFCLQEKGREWIDEHIHSYMPIGAPHGGSHLTVKLGATGAGLIGLVDNVMLSDDEGLIMYRSWGSGPWLMPREIPRGVFPPCIVRREGELGIQVASEIDVGPLFAGREKLPKELRLTIVFRGRIRASTALVPLEMDETTTPVSMKVSFHETFYLAVPFLEEEDELGDLIFYLEEPLGRLYQHHESKFRRQFQNATGWARGFKKEFTKMYRQVVKSVGSANRVAVCERPLRLKASDFELSTSASVCGKPIVESVIPFCKCKSGSDAERILDESEKDYEEDEDFTIRSPTVAPICDSAIGSLVIQVTYSPSPDFSKGSNCTTKFAVIPEDTPKPPIKSRKRAYNTIDHEKIVYDAWHGRDLYDMDGFMENMFELYEKHYDGDPLGPTTKSALDAPPVNCVRAIYGINVPTEISAVYRKQPVVTIGDDIADSRYIIDKSATFATDDAAALSEATVSGYNLYDGIISETSETLQNVPGTTSQRKCCGDGTVPYWSLVHCLNWKDSVREVTADELEGAVHRSVLSDQRFLALLKQYCTVEDPRLISTDLTTTPGGGQLATVEPLLTPYT